MNQSNLKLKTNETHHDSGMKSESELLPDKEVKTMSSALGDLLVEIDPWNITMRRHSKLWIVEIQVTNRANGFVQGEHKKPTKALTEAFTKARRLRRKINEYKAGKIDRY